jgi:hypothetical protein
VTTSGNPLVLGHAPRARTISAAFLAGFNDHFYEEGHGIFAKIYKDHPVEYFWGLVTLAKVMKVEIGGPHEFDRPATREEALDRLERTAGPQARKMLERFLDRVGKAEAKYLQETENNLRPKLRPDPIE